MPIGRAIPVETGFGERFPSTESKQSRFRDSDATIEIILQDSLNDSSTCNGQQPGKELQLDSKAFHDDEADDTDEGSDHHIRHSHSLNEQNPSFPSNSPGQYHQNSKIRSPPNIADASMGHHGGRLAEGTSRGGRHDSPRIARRNNHEQSVDRNSGRSAPASRQGSPQIEERRERLEDYQTSEASPARAVSTARELSSEQRGSEHDDRLALDDSIEVGDDIASEYCDYPGDDGLDHSFKKQKLSSRVEQPTFQENGDKETLGATHSNNSRAKSGSSKDYQKRREGGEEVMQGLHSRRTGDSRRRHEERNVQRKDDYVRDGKHEIDRNHMTSKERETLHHSYPHKDWDSSSSHHVRGRSETFDRQRDIDGGLRRDNTVYSRRLKDEDTRRERNEEAGSKSRNRVNVGDSNAKDDNIHLKKRVDDGDLRVRHREGSSRLRGREDMLLRRRENLDEPPVTKRNRAEEYPRREKPDREDTLHGHRARDDSNRKKREKDDGADYRRMEDDTRMRDKGEDRHSIKPKDDSWRLRDREDRLRAKPSHKDPQAHREREGRYMIRNGRIAEDKMLAGNEKNKDDLKGLGSDKDNQHKDRRRQSEQLKRVDRAVDRNDSQYRGREEAHAQKKQTNTEEKSLRREKMMGHSDRHSTASDSQQIPGEKNREHTRKSKDTEAGAQNRQSLGKRRHEEDTTHQKVKVSKKESSERGHHDIHENPEVPQSSHPSGIFEEEDPVSEDDSQKGRSKLERWASHRERETADVAMTETNAAMTETDVAKIQSLPSSSMAVEGSNSEMVPTDESTKTEGSNVSDSEPKDVDAGQLAEKMGEDQDPHLDTVAKLKKRSERFKLAMPGEKDRMLNKVENDVQSIQSDVAAAADLEIKTERPARKRRWTGS